jgi:protein TonB
MIISIQSGLLIYPAYPKEAFAGHLQGSVLLSLVVNAKGRPRDVSVKEGDPHLRQAAIDALKQWRFKLTVEGTPVEVETEIRMEFHRYQ